MIDLYHNPRCSKSRKTLALLEEYGESVHIIEYLKQPPDHQTLNKLLALLGLKPLQLMRKNEAIFKILRISERALSDAELMDIMIANPVLIERPIIVADDKAVIGRPPEAVLTIL